MVASEPLNFYIVVICELLPTYSFLLPFADCSFGNGRIDHLTDLPNDFTPSQIMKRLCNQLLINLFLKRYQFM